MARAIAFQRAKDAADARQARLEARHPSVSYTHGADRGADRDVPQVKDPGERQYQDQKQADQNQTPQ